MNEINVILLLILFTIIPVNSKDVLGCGGFIKSHVQIDFSKVEVRLLTKQGILKDKINCAPTNGYYFIPLYDKGEYILELNPPPGWSLIPTKIELNIDGTTDLCSQGKDINFVFKGFGITGNVESLGLKEGPQGVEVELKSDMEIRKTITSNGGSFFFTPVYPGSYIVRISYSKWKIFKEFVDVVVTEGNTELPSGSLVIQGYEVSGKVVNDGEPIKDTTILLFSSNNKSQIAVAGCNKEVLPGLKNTLHVPVCHVQSAENGVYTFPIVPPGKYYVTPFYSGQNIYYQPNSISFEITHESVYLEEQFEIIGFSITGRVNKDHEGTPLADAKIFLNSKEITKSSADGRYKLEKLKAGTYTLTAEFPNILFKEIIVKITPNSVLPDLSPSAYRVCGNIVTDKSHKITFSQIGSTNVVSTTSDRGKFCEFLSSGRYEVQVEVSHEDLQKGLQFFPKTQLVEIKGNDENIVTFSQLRAKIFGKVRCLRQKDYEGLQVILHSMDEFNPQRDVLLNIVGYSYELSDVSPGRYQVSIVARKLCWKADKFTVNVNSISVEIPTFIQSGYSISFISSHNTQITYSLPGQSTIRRIEVGKGRTVYCLEKSGVYLFQVSGCHTYETNSVIYNTEDIDSEITLDAEKHTITLLIQSEDQVSDVSAVINIDGVKTGTGILPFKGDGYEINLILRPNGSAIIVPHSELLYFNPPILSVGGRNDCEYLGAKFKASRGIVFRGKVIPPLAGVLITVEAENLDSLMAETDDEGVYKFPPLDKSILYNVMAKKNSYVFQGPDKEGNFLAHKLAEIVIEVLDRVTHARLEGTLLSLSGGESYRSNLKTNQNGKITFHSLSPGEYFLRPMMKEYNFEPNSKIIAVKEGQTVSVKLLGNRVAYSAYGQVTSLNEEPEENIIVDAHGIGNCSHFSEEATSESTGMFRIRGLQPYCSYTITVRNHLTEKNVIERSVPSHINIDKISEDISNLKFLIFRPASNVDLLVKVNAESADHYRNLRVKVVRESSQVVYSGRIDISSINIANEGKKNNGVLVHIPAIPLDNKVYSVSLESSQLNRLEPEPENFIANSSFKFIELDFMVKKRANEQHIKRTSISTIIFIITFIIGIYNIEKISEFIKSKMANYSFAGFTIKNQTSGDHVIDNVDIDKIVESIVSVKRKPKPKKL